MTATIATKPFLAALDSASIAAATGRNLPILSCALVEFTKDSVSVTCDNLDARVKAWSAEVKCDKPFAFCVGANLLRYAMRGEEAVLTLDKLRLTIKSGGVTTLSTLAVDEFPQPWKQVARHPVDPVEFLGGIKAAVSCVGSDSGSEFLKTCIHWDQSLARMVGCDGKMLATAPVALLMDEPFTLPGSQAKLILSCFNTKDEGLTAGVSDTVFCVSTSDRTLWVKLHAGKYFNYSQVIPASKPFASVNRDALVVALKSLVPFCDDGYVYHKVRVEVGDDAWTLSTRNNQNESSVSLDVEVGEKVDVFSINPSRLLSILQNWACDTIAVTLNGALLIHPEQPTGQLGVTTLYHEA